MKNVIILGAGRTGSSILAGLISYNRYYINREGIISRPGYPEGDYENPELVKLNQDILNEAGYPYSSLQPNTKVSIEKIEQLVNSPNIEKYKKFHDKCNQNEPWLWKDPRLVFTIYFWKRLIDLNNVNFIFITRDIEQIFRSHVKYYVVYSKKDAYNKYNYQIKILEKFFNENNIKPLHIDYSELKQKEHIIKKLNTFLGTNITVEDYDTIFVKNISQKEHETVFLTRYFFGLFKLKISNLLSKILNKFS